MALVEETLTLETGTASTGTATGETIWHGLLGHVRLKIGTLSTPTITLKYTGSDDVETTLLTLTGVSANAVYNVRHQAHGNDGTALVLNSDDDPLVVCPYVGGKLTCTVASGGASKSGALTVVIDRP